MMPRLIGRAMFSACILLLVTGIGVARAHHIIVAEDDTVDLARVTTLLQAWESSISGYDVSYRSTRTFDPSAIRRMQDVIRRDSQTGRVRGSKESSGTLEEAPNHEERFHVISAGQRIRITREHISGTEVRVFDGTATSQIDRTLDGVASHGVYNGGAENVVLTADSPIVFSGIGGGPNSQPLYRRLQNASASVVKGKPVNNLPTWLLTIHPNPVHGDRTTNVYLDPKHDFLPVRIESYDAAGKLFSVTHVNALSEFPDRASGSQKWFPTDAVHEFYNPITGGLLESTTRISVTDAVFNPTIADDAFRLEMPAGIPVTDGITRETRIRGGSSAANVRDELAQRTVSRARDAATTNTPTERAVQVRATVKQFPVAVLAYALGGVSCALVVIGLWLLKRR